MDAWSRAVARAFNMTSIYGEPGDRDKYLSAFAQRWGALEQGTLFRVLHERASLDTKLFALLTLGELGTAEARETLLCYLNSTVAEERWASAICLGEMRELAALQVLIDILAESVPPRMDYQRGDLCWYWRRAIPITLGNWGDPAAIVPLRQTLQAATHHLDDLRGDVLDTSSDGEFWEWEDYEFDIVYALGQLQALGALTGIEARQGRLDVWRIHLVLGSRHGQYRLDTIRPWSERPELLREVDALLESLFGMSKEERVRGLERYEVEKAYDMAARYKREFIDHKLPFED